MKTGKPAGDCACGLPRRECTRYLQVDFVRNNNLPCRILTADEIKNKKAQRVGYFIQKAVWYAFYYTMLFILFLVCGALLIALLGA